MSQHKTLADQLQKAFKDSPLTVTAIAAEAGIPQPILHRFMSGEWDLTLTTADNLLKYFELELEARGVRDS